jgi:hypothetical protein
MTERRRLPFRRASTNFDIESQGLRFTVTSTIEGCELREVFINNHKAGGVPVEFIRKALMRDANGKASSPLGTALNIIAEREGGR